MKRLFIVICAVAALAAAVFVALLLIYRPIAPTHPQLASADLAPLVPLRRFYADSSSRWRYQLSRDGKWLSWLESRWLKPALHVRALDGGEASIFTTDDEVRWYVWSADSRYLVYQADRDGWENDVIVSLDVEKPEAEPKSYDFGNDVKSFIAHVPEGAESTIIVGHNGRDRSRFDLYRLDLDTGETTPLVEAGTRRPFWFFTRDGEIWARSLDLDSGGFVFETKAGDQWIERLRVGPESRFRPIAGPTEGGTFTAISNRGRDRSALVRVDLDDLSETVIAEDGTVDYGGAWLDTETGRPLIGFAAPGRQRRDFFDERMRNLFGRLDASEAAAVHIHTVTDDRSKMVVSVETPQAGFVTKLIDMEAETVETLSVPSVASLEEVLVDVAPVRFEVRDGMPINAYLTRPKGVDGPVPLVIIVHGGPLWRAYGGWNSTHQWLANRGYAVLDVNYRGSDGYGRAFRKAAYGEGSRAMDDDVADARGWAIAEGIADPDRIAVMGGSYGGLMTLTALTRNPDAYRAGVAINAISDLRTFFSEIPAYWEGGTWWFHHYFADPSDRANHAMIDDRSPLTHAEQLQAPLLLIQGTNDVRVVKAQGDRMAERLTQLGKPVDYIVLDGLGHQSRNWGWKTRLKVNRRVERFLAEHLGGRADGFDYAVFGADILPAGVGQ